MKYKITEETVDFQGHKLHRIQALKDIKGRPVKSGDLGGLIEKESNLSQEDNCWLTYDAVIMDNARVISNSFITENAIIKDEASVSGHSYIGGNAVISEYASVMHFSVVNSNVVIKGHAVISDMAHITDDAIISGISYISGTAIIRNNAIVNGNASISDNVVIGSNAVIQKSTDYLYVKNPRLCEFAGLTAYKEEQGNIIINIGAGNSYVLDELIQKVSQISDIHRYNDWSAYIKFVQAYFYK